MDGKLRVLGTALLVGLVMVAAGRNMARAQAAPKLGARALIELMSEASLRLGDRSRAG